MLPVRVELLLNDSGFEFRIRLPWDLADTVRVGLAKCILTH